MISWRVLGTIGSLFTNITRTIYMKFSDEKTNGKTESAPAPQMVILFSPYPTNGHSLLPRLNLDSGAASRTSSRF